MWIKEKRADPVYWEIGRWDDQITTNAKLLDIKYEFYGFSGDIIETTNLRIYQCGKVVFVAVFTSSIAMCKIFMVVVVF